MTKIIKLNGDLLKISRDACFLTARVTELFLERAVVEAAGEAARGGRKTVTLKDIITSMRNHPNPESLQAFVGAPAARRSRSCRPACTSASTSSTSSTGTSTSAAIYRRARRRAADELLLPPGEAEPSKAPKPKPKRAPASKKRASPAPGEGGEAPAAKAAKVEAEGAAGPEGES